MEKTIEISGQQVNFKTSGAIPKRYKMQFQRDFFKDLLGMGALSSVDGKVDVNDIQNINFEVFYDIAWTMAKTADNKIPDPMTWLDGFDEFPIIEILPELQDMLAATISTTKKK